VDIGRDFKRVLLLADRDADSLLAIRAGLASWGCEVQVCDRHSLKECSGLPFPEFDLIFGYGPHNGTMMPVADRILSTHPGNSRPFFVWWLLENLPDPRLPEWFSGVLASARVHADRWLRSPVLGGTKTRLSSLLLRGQRFRILGELCWMWRQGVLGAIVTASEPRSQVFRRRGIPALTVPFGYHSAFGTDLGLQRDIDVVFLGQPGSRRRRLLLNRLSCQLAQLGLRLTIADGSSGFLHDMERTHFLNRCRVIVNLLKMPHDSVGHRFLLAAANKVLLISEPLYDCEQFEPGQHYIAVHPAQMAETIHYFCRHEEERARIADTAHRYVTEERTIHCMTGKILNYCRAATEPSNTRAETSPCEEQTASC
jgi:hypothetical protein